MPELDDDVGRQFPIPPPELIWRVTGSRDEEWFLSSGLQSRQDLDRALAAARVDMSNARCVLDFGCGSGRMLRWFADLEGPELHGIDIDADAIAWAQEHLPCATFHHGPGLPPTEFEDDSFDLIVNHSVFTHLDEHYQDCWMTELQRITEPDGILVLSVSGELPFHGYEKTLREGGADPEPARDRLEREGILYVADDSWQDSVFPDFYHSAFHAPWYVLEHWQRWFELAAYIPRGNLGFQDTVVMRNRSAEARVPVISRR